MNWKEFHLIKKPLIEENLRQHINLLEENSVLKDAMLYSLEAGGKRLRPFLAIVTANLLGKDESSIYPYASALEFIHTYSLIHDDLPAMDNDDLRRGKPTSHKIFGEDIAILAGDALLTDAFTLIMQEGNGNIKRGGTYLANAAGGKGMVIGQVHDCKIPQEKRDVATLDMINLKKTGCMIQASLAGAAAFLDADEKTVLILEEYGKNIGLAFQITDDILDITADEAELGKPIGSDAKLGKATYPTLLGLDGAKKAAAEYVESAKKCAGELPANKFRDMLIDFSDYILERRN